LPGHTLADVNVRVTRVADGAIVQVNFPTTADQAGKTSTPLGARIPTRPTGGLALHL
jgi:hypothetical protein